MHGPTDRIALAFIIVVAALLRLPYLGAEGLLTDEFPAYWMAAAPSIGELRERVAEHSGTWGPIPFFHLATRASLHLFGPGEFALRLPSALFGIASVVALHALARRLLGQPAALLAALFLAVDRFAIRHAQGARPYTLAFLLLTLAAWALAAILTSPSRPRHRLCFALASGFAATCHALYAPAALVLLIILAARVGRLPASERRFAIVSGTASLALLAPSLVHLTRMAGSASELAWGKAATLEDFTLFVFRPDLVLGLGVGLAVAASLGLGAVAFGEGVSREQRNRIRSVGLLALASLLPPFAALALSRFSHLPLFVERYLSPWALPLYLVLGALAASLGRRAATIAGIAIVLAAAGAPFARLALGRAPHSYGHDGMKRALLRLDATPDIATVLFRSPLIEADTERRRSSKEAREYLSAPLASFYLAEARRDRHRVIVAPYSGEGLIRASDALAAEILLALGERPPPARLAVLVSGGLGEFYAEWLRSRPELGLHEIERFEHDGVRLTVFGR